MVRSISIFISIYWKVILARFYFFISHFYLICLKRRSAVEKGIANDSHRPDINLIRMSNRALHYFRSNVIWCATHGSFFLVHKLQLSGQSKISHFYFHVAVQENIAKFEVAMDNTIAMHIINCRNELNHEISSLFCR